MTTDNTGGSLVVDSTRGESMPGQTIEVPGSGPGQQSPGPYDWIPAKYRTPKQDGSLDLEASARKQAESHASLERRLGVGDVRPSSANEYRLEVPETLQEMVAALPEEGIRAFQAEAHQAGLTQEQYAFVMSKYLEVAPTLVRGARQLDRDTATSELRQTWPDQASFDSNVKAAGRAVLGYAGEEARSILDDYGNDPRIVRMMAKIGAEMGEDRSPRQQLASSGGSLDELRASEAYRNPKHPDHARVSATVAGAMQRIHGTDRITG